MQKMNFNIAGQLLYCLNQIAEHNKSDLESALRMSIYMTFSKLNTAQLRKKTFEFPSVGYDLPDAQSSWNATVKGVTLGCLEGISDYLRITPENTLLICIAEGYVRVCQAKSDITPTKVIMFEPVS